MFYETELDIDLFSDEDLRKARALRDAYEERRTKVFHDTILGKYPEFTDMMQAFDKLSKEYKNEFYKIMRHNPYDFIRDGLGSIEKLSKRYSDPKDFAFTRLRIEKSVMETFYGRREFVNDKGQTCDEYGNPLSADGEHRVFDIIDTKKD